MAAYVTGLSTGLALIVAIGAQNAYVLRQGIRREHVGLIVAICAVSDVLLIAVGTLGIGALVTRAPALLEVLRWGGVAYLVWFAATALRSAAGGGSLAAAAGSERVSARRAGLLAASLTYLNPHVYLDTVVMVGNLANQQGALRWAFAGGAGTASIGWFTGLGYGARALAPVLDRPATWRVVDVGVGLVMLAVAARLALGG
ncbi:MAG: LysE/ArgO family amino acid transporter [Actinobacteria bacterium]|nr:LysE/ArgO family amino acid transporter [Actinomycetota bacterium]